MISTRFLIFLIPLIGSRGAQYFSDDSGTIVQLDKGTIQGIIRESENGSHYWAFQEIPYAAPPVGANRFQLPQEPEAWDGILNATANTKICYQAISRHDYLNITEDCLYINVYTPVKPGSEDLLPVLLWIHGGGFAAESGVYDYYGPKYIMDHGVVVVSFNYRLGPFGFVGTEDGIVPLNLGLKDQRLAIEWVHNNIYLFGGNPDQVTLVGESAGSVAVGYHLISQNSEKSLFHAVIMQSGTPVSKILKQLNSTQNAFKLGRAVNSSFTSNNSEELLNTLQNANAKDILAAGITGAVSLENEGLYSYRGFQAFIDKNFTQLPVLIGFNSEEWLNLANRKNNTLMQEIDDDPSLLIDATVHIAPGNRSIVGELYKYVYVGNSSFIDYYGGYIKYVSDSMFSTGISKQVELCSEDIPYYFYQFAYKGKLGGPEGNFTPPSGAEQVAHAEDLHYMWDDTTNSDLSKYPPEDGLMLHRYVKMWTNFVKYFNPTPEADPLLDNFIWQASEPESLKYLNINATFEMREHPRQYQQIKEILEKYMEKPYDTFS